MPLPSTHTCSIPSPVLGDESPKPQMFWWLSIAVFLTLLPFELLAHGVAAADKAYIQQITGVHIIPFIYLGAKHMVTGYDHILFIIAVVFFLYRMKEVFIYVSLFAIGHSLTLIAGVYFDFGINSSLIDAVIGFSIVYKALDNLGAYQRWFGVQPDTKIATFIFGLFHGLGLATKILDYEISPAGLLENLLAFNVGVEFGQLVALAFVLIAMSWWRKSRSFFPLAYATNVFIMCAGFTLIGLHLTGYVINV